MSAYIYTAHAAQCGASRVTHFFPRVKQGDRVLDKALYPSLSITVSDSMRQGLRENFSVAFGC